MLVDQALVEHRDDLRVVAVGAVHVFEAEPIGHLRRVVAGEQHRVGAALAAFLPAQEISIAEAVLPGQVGVPRRAIGIQRTIAIGDDL